MMNSYPQIYNLGHAAIADLLKGPVIVEEKADGSQISFSKDENSNLSMRSKGAQINLEAPEGMFAKAVETVKEIAPLMQPGYTYRGEFLSNPHHNCLTYDRVPKKYIIIFDIQTGNESYLSPWDKHAAANALGLECVPVLHSGLITNHAQLTELLNTTSILGGQKIEGVVIKPANYDLFGRDKKVLMGKFVSESFREVHANWKEEHGKKSGADIIQLLAIKYGTQARWNKAVQHLTEANSIEHDPRDIGKLMKEVPEDVLKECEEEIHADLMNWAWPQLRRAIVRGVPEWYKETLAKRQFEQN